MRIRNRVTIVRADVLYENGQVLCENRVASACDSKNTKLLDLRFRTLLGEAGTRHIELARA